MHPQGEKGKEDIRKKEKEMGVGMWGEDGKEGGPRVGEAPDRNEQVQSLVWLPLSEWGRAGERSSERQGRPAPRVLWATQSVV